MKEEHPLDPTCVSIERSLDGVSLEPRSEPKLRLVSIARTEILADTEATVPQQHSTVVEGPYGVFSVQVAGSQAEVLAREEQSVLT